MTNRKRKGWLAFAFALALVGCVRDYDALKNSKIADWTPNVVVPLVDDELSIEDLTGSRLAENELDTNAAGYLVFHFFGLVRTPIAAELLNIPNQAFPPVVIPPAGNPPAGTTLNGSQVLPIDMGANRLLKVIRAKGGSLDLDLDNRLGIPLSVMVNFPSIRNSTGGNLSITLPLSPNQRTTRTVALAGYTLQLDGQNPAYNRIPMQVQATVVNGPGVPPGSGLRVQADLNNLAFSYVEGWIGDLVYEASRLDQVNIKIFDNILDEGDNELFFADPAFKLHALNTGGVPAAISLTNIRSYQNINDTKILTGPGVDSLSPGNPWIIGAARQVAQGIDPFNSFRKLNKNNTNVNDIFKFYLNVPRTVEYSASVRTAPGAPTNQTQWLEDTSRIRVYSEVELPLDGYSRRLALQDTFDLNLPENTNDVVVEQATVKTVLTNGFPVNGELQVFLVDDAYNRLDSLYRCTAQNRDLPECRFFSSAVLGSNGRVQSPTVTEKTAVMDQARYARLQGRAKRVIVRCIMRTTESQPAPPRQVQIYPESRLRFQMGLAIKTRTVLN